MKVRFGYVSHALSLWEARPSKTLTFKRFKEMTKQERTDKLLEVTKTNIYNTKRALLFNRAAEIPLYRFSSTIVPLATHPEAGWDYVSPFREEWRELGEIVREAGLRVSFHPGQFTLFTSDKEHVIENSIRDMDFHYSMLEAMGLEQDGYINIHIGGAYGDKSSALDRFKVNIMRIPDWIRNQMTIENDDKTYTGVETLEMAELTNTPIMFDYHHEMANPSTVPYEESLERLLGTWRRTGLPPKVHLSSPKSEKQYRSHANFVDLEFALPFLKACRNVTDELDVMIEAKEKDRALLQFVDELAAVRGVKRVAGGIVEF